MTFVIMDHIPTALMRETIPLLARAATSTFAHAPTTQYATFSILLKEANNIAQSHLSTNSRSAQETKSL